MATHEIWPICALCGALVPPYQTEACPKTGEPLTDEEKETLKIRVAEAEADGRPVLLNPNT